MLIGRSKALQMKSVYKKYFLKIYMFQKCSSSTPIWLVNLYELDEVFLL